MKCKKQITGYLLASLLLLTLLNSAYFFLQVAKFGIVDWLAFNACSLSIIAYLICFVCFQLTKENHYLAIALLPLYYYGTMGLFVTPWNVTNIFAQITHIIITLNVIWILYVLLKKSDYKSLSKGLLIGLLIFVPIFVVIQNYSQLHIDEFMQIIQKVQ